MKEIILTPETPLYHGTRINTNKILNLGLNHEFESYAYVTPNPSVAATYAFKKKGLMSWFPKKNLKVGVVNSDFLREVIKKYGDEIVSEELLMYSYSKLGKGVSSVAAKRKKTKEALESFKKQKHFNKKRDFSVHNITKSMKIKEFFGEGIRWKVPEKSISPIFNTIHNFTCLIKGINVDIIRISKSTLFSTNRSNPNTLIYSITPIFYSTIFN